MAEEQVNQETPAETRKRILLVDDDREIVDSLQIALKAAGYEVLIGGVRRPLAGMVTMDQIVVDCGDDDSVRPGDEAVLLGRQGTEAVTADDWASMLGTISYEIVCGVGPRMPRVLVNHPDAPGG